MRPTATEREQRLNEVMAAYVQAADAGQAPDRAEILARHPDLAADLEAFFADHDRLNRLAEPLRAVAVETGGPGDHGRPRTPGSPSGTTAEGPAGTAAVSETVDRSPPGKQRTRRARPPRATERSRNRFSRGLASATSATTSCSRELGRGGMGVVYQARQVSLNRAGRPQDDPGRRRWPATTSCGGSSNEAEAVADARPPGHRADLRGRRARGPALLQHEAGRGRQPRRRGSPTTRRSRGPRRGCVADGRPGGAPRPPARHPPPRPQAGQHPARRRGPAARHRLRPGQAGRGRRRADRSRARSWARRPTWRPSRPAGGAARSRRRPTSTAWGRSSTRC